MEIHPENVQVFERIVFNLRPRHRTDPTVAFIILFLFWKTSTPICLAQKGNSLVLLDLIHIWLILHWFVYPFVANRELSEVALVLCDDVMARSYFLSTGGIEKFTMRSPIFRFQASLIRFKPKLSNDDN